MHTQRVHQSNFTPRLHSERETTKNRQREGKKKGGNGCEGGLVSVDSRVDSSSPVLVCGSLSLPAPVCLSTQHQSGAIVAQGCKENISRCSCVWERGKETIKV